MRIALVVENAEDAELLQSATHKHGHEIVELVTSITALRAVLKKTAADILVFALEHVNHRQLRQIERIYLGQPCPIVMFTRQGDAPTINAALKAGISAYIVDGLWPERVKPIMDVAIIRFNETQLLLNQLEQTHTTAAERRLIGQAAAILMQKARISRNGAQQALRRLALNRNKRTVDVAQDFIVMEQSLLAHA
jgi:response regulator NasT